MGLFDFIGPASGLLFTLENIIWINLGVFQLHLSRFPSRCPVGISL